MTSLDGNYREVINLLFVLPGLYSNINLKLRKYCNFGNTKFSTCVAHLVPTREINKLVEQVCIRPKSREILSFFFPLIYLAKILQNCFKYANRMLLNLTLVDIYISAKTIEASDTCTYAHLTLDC